MNCVSQHTKCRLLVLDQLVAFHSYFKIELILNYILQINGIGSETRLTQKEQNNIEMNAI
jgi:hypothetical protein